ncbi:MAG TPA: hypothetical protein VNV13_05145 [Steroidobacteraceae bacterium]|jgi:hypothetical protein|nr:hypothetical protein [Steroidobacteraceae bacterium]
MERDLVSGDAPQEAVSVLTGGEPQCSPQPAIEITTIKTCIQYVTTAACFARREIFLSQRETFAKYLSA